MTCTPKCIHELFEEKYYLENEHFQALHAVGPGYKRVSVAIYPEDVSFWTKSDTPKRIQKEFAARGIALHLVQVEKVKTKYHGK